MANIQDIMPLPEGKTVEFKCAYQAKVIATLDPIRRNIVGKKFMFSPIFSKLFIKYLSSKKESLESHAYSFDTSSGNNFKRSSVEWDFEKGA